MSASEIQYKRGDFQPYKAITKVHLGALESDLEEGEVVLYDGTTMRRGPDDVQLATLRAAIKVGWLIPEDEEAQPYVARSAGVEIRPAESRGRERGPARVMGVVEDEERSVGTLNEVRGPNAPRAHHAKHAAVEIGADGKARSRQQEDRGGRHRVVSESGQEGRVVGRFKNAAQAGTVDVVKDGNRTKQQIMKSEGRQHVGTGGDDLEELLPNAASSGVPRGGRAGEGDGESADERAMRLAAAKTAADAKRASRMGVAVKAEAEAKGEDPDNVAVPDHAKSQPIDAGAPPTATVSGGGPAIRMGDKAKVENTSGRAIDASVTVSKGSDSVGLGSDGDVVGKIGEVPRGVQPPAAPPEMVTESDQEAEDETEVAPEQEVEVAATPAGDVDDSQAIIDAKIAMIAQFVPGFQWDMSVQWAKRAKIAVDKYGQNMPVINAILSLETAAVRKDIMKRLYGND
jgi:hypothetical protein